MLFFLLYLFPNWFFKHFSQNSHTEVFLQLGYTDLHIGIPKAGINQVIIYYETQVILLYPIGYTFIIFFQCY